MSFSAWLLPFVVAGSAVCLVGARDWPARAWRLWGLLAVAAGALLLGRLGYLGLNSAFFVERPAVWLGDAAAGYSAHTAWVGGWLGWRLSGRRVPAHLLAAAGLLAAIGVSFGCAQAACAYGREVGFGDGLLWLLRVDGPDAYGLSNPRIPAQLFQAAWLGGGLLILALMRDRLAKRDIIPAATLWFALGDLVIQLMRSDPSPEWFGLRAQMVLDGILILSVALAFARRRPTANRPPS